MNLRNSVLGKKYINYCNNVFKDTTMFKVMSLEKEQNYLKNLGLSQDVREYTLGEVQFLLDTLNENGRSNIDSLMFEAVRRCGYGWRFGLSEWVDAESALRLDAYARLNQIHADIRVNRP